MLWGNFSPDIIMLLQSFIYNLEINLIQADSTRFVFLVRCCSEKDFEVELWKSSKSFVSSVFISFDDDFYEKLNNIQIITKEIN